MRGNKISICIAMPLPGSVPMNLEARLLFALIITKYFCEISYCSRTKCQFERTKSYVKEKKLRGKEIMIRDNRIFLRK